MTTAGLHLPLKLERGQYWYHYGLGLTVIMLCLLPLVFFIPPASGYRELLHDPFMLLPFIFIVGPCVGSFVVAYIQFDPAQIVINEEVILVTPRNWLNRLQRFQCSKYHRHEFTCAVAAYRTVGSYYHYTVKIGGVNLIGEIEGVKLRVDTPTGMDDDKFARGLAVLLNLKFIDVTD